jgi:hypothetical protein
MAVAHWGVYDPHIQVDELGAEFRRHLSPLQKGAIAEAADHPPKARGPVPEAALAASSFAVTHNGTCSLLRRNAGGIPCR